MAETSRELLQVRRRLIALLFRVSEAAVQRLGESGEFCELRGLLVPLVLGCLQGLQQGLSLLLELRDSVVVITVAVGVNAVLLKGLQELLFATLKPLALDLKERCLCLLCPEEYDGVRIRVMNR